MVEHKHAIIRCITNKTPTDPKYMKEWLCNLVDDIGMKLIEGFGENVIAGYCNSVPGNRGLTVIGIIETSHIALHTWDEESPGLMQLDVYTCGKLNITTIINSLREFDLVDLEYKIFDREYRLIEVKNNRIRYK